MISRRSINGFTLVEIMVVVSIGIIFAGFLFPIFLRARENGRRTVCQNNLTQIALALQQYVADHDGRYPSSRDWEHDAAPYIKNRGVFRCPTPRDTDPNPLNVTDGYLYNFRRLTRPEIGFTSGRNEATLPNASLIWVNMDGEVIWRYRIVTSRCGRVAEYPTIHSGGANFSFADGHIKWLTSEQIGEIECGLPPVTNGFSP